MIAIVPASVISGTSTKWLRTLLISKGNVKIVHELPNWTFAGIDGKIYILVYEHGHRQGPLSVRNHRLIRPDVLRISSSKATSLGRWDFGYVQARHWHDALLDYPQFKWTAVSAVSDICRGQVDSPINCTKILHTTNFLNTKLGAQRATKDCDVRPGDIIIKRVDRRSALSPALFCGLGPVRASDCILRIRPKTGASSEELLFALRTVISWPVGSALVERGVGAKYITISDLASIRIPLGLGEAYPQLFDRYRALIAKKKWQELATIEAEVRRRLMKKTL